MEEHTFHPEIVRGKIHKEIKNATI